MHFCRSYRARDFLNLNYEINTVICKIQKSRVQFIFTPPTPTREMLKTFN